MKQRNLLMLLMMIFTIFTISAIVPNALAIGASPAKVSMNYEPNKEITIPYTVRSNTDRDILVNITLLGNLSKYAKISENNIPLKPGETATFDLTIKFPVLSGYVGPNDILVSVAESAPAGGGFASRTIVIPKITINFPYPGKYLDITKFHVSNTNQGSPASIDMDLISRGTEFTSFSASVDVLDENNQTVYSKDIASGGILPQKTYSTTSELAVSAMKSGEYTAVLNVNYATEKKIVSQKFRIGTESLNLEDYEPKNATSDSVIPLKLQIKNDWNGNFDNVYGEIKIANATATTPTKKIGAFGDITLEQFIDLRGLEPGEYNGTVTIHFDKNVKKFPITIDVLKSESANSSTLLIAIIIIIVVILGLSVVLFMRKGINKQKNHSKKTAQSKK